MCGYYGFRFRYQDSEQRKRVYINPLNTESTLPRDGTQANPYLTLSDALHSIEDLPDKNDYLSASFYLMGPVEVDATIENPIGLEGGVHDWFTSDHIGLNQLEDRTGGGRQVITVEADPSYFNSKPDYFNVDEQFPSGPKHEQVMLIPYNGGGPSRFSNIHLSSSVMDHVRLLGHQTRI